MQVLKMKIKNTFSIKINELLFFIAYGIFLFFSTLSTTLYYKYFSGRIYSMIILMCMLIITLGEILYSGKCGWKKQTAIVSAALIYIIISYSSNSFFTTIGLIPFLLLSATRIEFKKIAKFTAVALFAILTFVILSAELHIIKNVVVHSASGRTRYFLGFRFPLNAPAIMFNITALWLYYRKNSLKIIEAAALLLINLWLYKKTDSKLSFVSAVIIIAAFTILCFVLKYAEDFLVKRKTLTFLLASSFVIAFAFSIFAALTYDSSNEWMRGLNRLTEDRLKFANMSLTQYGVTLFGEDIPWVGYGLDDSGKAATGVYANYFYVDNMYIQIMQKYGLIFMAFYIVFNTMAMFKCRKNNDIYMLLIVSLICMKCIVDNLSFYMYYNTFWFIISCQLFNNVKLKDTYIYRFLMKKIKAA